MSSLRVTWRRLRLAVVLLLVAVIAVPALGAVAPASAAASSLPCDVYAAGGTPCEAAYSMTRALFAAYDGPLYQLQRTSDGSYLNIGPGSTGGVVDSAPQVSFCSGTSCTVTEIYDQTSNGNNLPISQGTACSGCSGGIAGPGPNGSDIGSPAMALPVTVDGRPAYGALFDAQGTGYRIDDAKNVPTGSQPEGVYLMTSSNVTSNGCCFDFGSGEANDSDDGNATMNAIYYGTDCWTQNCSGPGPWVGGDLENGMYFSDTGANPSSIPAESGSFVSAWEKNNGTTNFTLKYGNGQQGGLTESYSGALPSGYDPMKVQPSIELGTGGDNSIWGDGEFFEGAVTAGYPSDATENAVQAGLVAAGYSHNVTDVPTTASVVSLKAHANGDYVDSAGSGTSLIANSTSIGADQTFDLLTNPDGTVSLRAHSDGDYVTAPNAGAAPLIAGSTAIGSAETFDLIDNPDGSVSFRAHANGDIVTADNAGASPLIANRTAIGPWEEFDVVRDTVPVSFRAHANGDIVTADNAGASPLIANRTAVGPWETFDLIGDPDGSVSLLARANNEYVTAGASALIANSASIGYAQEFSLIDNADGSVSLKAHANGEIVTADGAGADPLIANRSAIGPWEEFDLIDD
ncbi:arabinofuranosidase catalytic domain-containing protein [Streptacidiphilus sp. P02-A3a]|uniref:arabinofuranosidase catalytic domain-containing protein n=1 Tax=Streptacidiphilus sp. P02-A3a TaxID=2704468 RepID=UPI0015FD666B|nr:arabinofuranosidase catalytic domain-containing protein [Streptacidiphilus sp. P02-A3a]QMU70236.1 xylan 1,4-beta-xylosidase [Streptacidiphilus sp. P02-A3a]QMU70308.1 xylan 1,4-beta-xylosidase [Streptacidiphilus sp. P02-A3a]